VRHTDTHTHTHTHTRCTQVYLLKGSVRARTCRADFQPNLTCYVSYLFLLPGSEQSSERAGASPARGRQRALANAAGARAPRRCGRSAAKRGKLARQQPQHQLLLTPHLPQLVYHRPAQAHQQVSAL
jgi:hypothetical protein